MVNEINNYTLFIYKMQHKTFFVEHYYTIVTYKHCYCINCTSTMKTDLTKQKTNTENPYVIYKLTEQ